jgi:hypothetical protein
MAIILSFFSIWYIKIELFFLLFKFEKHEKIYQLLVTTVNDICEAQGVKYYCKSHDEINKNIKEGEDTAVGMYIYTMDSNYQIHVNDAYANIERLERTYNKPIEEIYQIADRTMELEKYEYVLPRIMISEKLQQQSIRSFYSTFLHELGHHFAVKKIGDNHNEAQANECAVELLISSFPPFFQLFFWDYLTFDSTNKMTFSRRCKAYYSYIQYMVNNFKVKHIWQY